LAELIFKASKAVNTLFYLAYIFSILFFLSYIYSLISPEIIIQNTSSYEIISKLLFFVSSFSFIFLSVIFKKLYISKLSIFLLIFISFVLLRTLIDFNDLNEFLTYSVSAGGGVLIHFLMGTLLMAQQNYLLNFTNVIRVKKVLNITMTFSLFLVLLVFLQIISNVNESVFLIDILRGSYQLPGKAFIMLVLFLQLMILNLNVRSINTRFSDFLFLLISFICAVSAQGFGSNTGLVVILLLALNFLGFRMISNGKNIKKILSLPFPSNTGFNIFSRSFQALMNRQFVTLIFITILSTFLIFNLFSEYLALFRIFSYGELGDLRSITSRYELLPNFFPQAEIGLFFGNLASDEITTGKGTYPHSFLLTLITHTGFFGTLIFLLFLINYLNKLFTIENYVKEKLHDVKKYKYFLLITFLMLFIYTNFATFFTWVPLWFFFGCTINMFNFYTYEKSFRDSP
tara:strand:- start:6 stop:1379 length:1374 start_codon:yes stop_codon:yes gene_type:complete